MEMAVDTRRQNTHRTTTTGARLYTVRTGTDDVARSEAVVSFTYGGLLQQHGHSLYIDLTRCTTAHGRARPPWQPYPRQQMSLVRDHRVVQQSADIRALICQACTNGST